MHHNGCQLKKLTEKYCVVWFVFLTFTTKLFQSKKGLESMWYLDGNVDNVLKISAEFSASSNSSSCMLIIPIAIWNKTRVPSNNSLSQSLKQKKIVSG